MALAIDGSTPAVVASGTAVATITTASFTPPAGSLLLVLWAGNTTSGASPPTPTITDSLGAPLTYTLTDWKSRADSPAVDGQAAAWWAVVGSSAAMTVTVTNGSASSINRHQALAVIVITGQHATPIGAHGKSGSASAASIAQAYTAQATSGWSFIAVCDWDALGNETAGTGCTLIGTGSIGTLELSYGFVRRTLADDSNGVSNTVRVTIPGTSTSLSWVYVEVLPAAGSAPDTLAIEPTIGQAQKPGRGQAGQSFVTWSRAEPSPVPLSVVVDPAAVLNWPPRAGSAVVIHPRSEPYLDPPRWRQPATTPMPTPRIGSGLILGPRTDAAGAIDVPPVTPVEAVRTPTRPVVGSATVTRSTAPPDFPPSPVVEVSRAATPPAWSPPANVTSPRVDSAGVADFPPAPIVEMSRPTNLGPASAGAATTTRPTADPAVTPEGPAPSVLVARSITARAAAPIAVVGRATADPLPAARQPIVITTIGMPAETLGWAALTRSTADPPPAGATQPGYLSGNPVPALAMAGNDRAAASLGGAPTATATLDSTGDRPEWELR